MMGPLSMAVMFFFFSRRRRHTSYWRDWSSDVCSSDLVNMCQGPAASERLLDLVPREALAVNPPESVLNCHRHRLVGHMAAAGLSFPRTLIVPTADPDALLPLVHQLNGDGRPGWVKRGDVRAETRPDLVAGKGSGVKDGSPRC